MIQIGIYLHQEDIFKILTEAKTGNELHIVSSVGMIYITVSKEIVTFHRIGVSPGGKCRLKDLIPESFIILR